MKHCDLVLDRDGAWWLQWHDAGNSHVRFLDARTQLEAEEEAHSSGFTSITVFHDSRKHSEVTIPKPPFP